VNFIEIDVILSPDDLRGFLKLFTNKSVYYESDADPHHQPLDKHKTAIETLHTVDWNITYTSQNYGWTLKKFIKKTYSALLWVNIKYPFNI